VTIDEAADAIADEVGITYGRNGRAHVLAILARMQAHRDERFRRIRELERRAALARNSQFGAGSGFGRKQAGERAAKLERAIRAIEVELGIRRASS